MLDGLPNCVFDASGPLRQYTKQARAAGFFAKMAELSGVGVLTGTATSLLSSAAVAIRKRANPEWEPSVAVPDVGRSSGGLAAYFALNANVRYQLLGGLDRFLFDRTNFLWTYLAMSGAARVVSNQVGELSRPWWQGLPSPSTLAARPMVRRIRKKVSKKVPRVKAVPAPAAPQGEAMAAAAVVAAPMAAGAFDGLDGSAQQQQVASSLAPAVAMEEGAGSSYEGSVQAAVSQAEEQFSGSQQDESAAPLEHTQQLSTARQ